MKAKGFTLIELLVVLTIAGVMMAYAIPAFNDFSSQRRMTSNINMLVSAVNYARNEAVRNGAQFTVQALDASNNANEWGPGFCVTAGDPGDCLNPLAQFTPEGNNIVFNAVNGLDGEDSWSFNSRGLITGGLTGQVQICGADIDDDPGRILRISAVGRASVGELACF